MERTILAEEQIGDDAVISFFVGCSWNRVWIVDLDGILVVVHVGSTSETRDEISFGS